MLIQIGPKLRLITFSWNNDRHWQWYLFWAGRHINPVSERIYSSGHSAELAARRFIANVVDGHYRIRVESIYNDCPEGESYWALWTQNEEVVFAGACSSPENAQISARRFVRLLSATAERVSRESAGKIPDP